MIQKIKNKYLEDMSIIRRNNDLNTRSIFFIAVFTGIILLVLLILVFDHTFIKRETIMDVKYQKEKIKVTRVYTPLDKTMRKIKVNGHIENVPMARIPDGFSINKNQLILFFDSDSIDSYDSLSFHLR